MKARNYIAYILVFFALTLCACNISNSFDETQTDDTLKQTDTNLESTDTGSVSASESLTPTDDPFCGPTNEEFDGIFVRTSIEDYVAQIEKHQSAKLVNYPTDIVAVFAQYGFTKAEDISLTRIKDLEGNYFRYEELSVIYSSPDCKNDKHNSFCNLHFCAAIREDYNPVKIENYTLTDTVNGVELYEYSGTYSFPYKLFLIKAGEFVSCSISIPHNTVSEEDTAKILDQLLVIAQDMREKLLETAPELITTP